MNLYFRKMSTARFHTIVILMTIVVANVFLTSCNNHSETTDILISLYGRCIAIPNYDVIINNGRIIPGADSSFSNNGKPMLLYYKKLEGCSLCEIGYLYNLDKISADTTYTTLVIVRPTQDIGKVIERIQMQQHGFPIVIDMVGTFEEHNPFIPNDPKYHTFLLDRERQITLVGDPLYNKKMTMLFNNALRMLQ